MPNPTATYPAEGQLVTVVGGSADGKSYPFIGKHMRVPVRQRPAAYVSMDMDRLPLVETIRVDAYELRAHNDTGKWFYVHESLLR